MASDKLYDEDKPTDTVETNVTQNNTEPFPSASAVDRNFIQQWSNRRRMAWLSLLSIIFFTVAGLFWIPESRLNAASNILTWYYMTASSITGLYMGLSTWASISQGQQGPPGTGPNFPGSYYPPNVRRY